MLPRTDFSRLETLLLLLESESCRPYHQTRRCLNLNFLKLYFCNPSAKNPKIKTSCQQTLVKFVSELAISCTQLKRVEDIFAGDAKQVRVPQCHLTWEQNDIDSFRK